MARNQRTYADEYKAQSVKLSQETGGQKAATELDILKHTYKKEESYQMTMYFVRRMREKGLITDSEYEAIDTKMRRKYQPVFVTFMEQI